MTSSHPKRARPFPASIPGGRERKKKKQEAVLIGPLTLEQYLKIYIQKLMNGQMSAKDLVRKRRFHLNNSPPDHSGGDISLGELQLVAGTVVLALKNSCMFFYIVTPTPLTQISMSSSSALGCGVVQQICN